MKNIFFITFFTLLTASGLKAHAHPKVQIFYTLSFPCPQTHELVVEMKVTGLHQRQLLLKMPVWAPGSYLIREFPKNIESITAEHNDRQLLIRKVKKNDWSVLVADCHSVIVRYKIYAFERSVQNSFVDFSHAFLSNPGIFIYPAGRLKAPSIIHIIPNEKWTTISTSLIRIKGASNNFYAPDFDTLFDSPFEIGNQDIVDFNVDKTHYRLAIYGGGNYNKVKIVNDLSNLIKRQTAVFGENPNRNYLFIMHNFESLTGDGLEHKQSSVLELSRNMYSDSVLYHIFLNVMSHEHFHLWNGKRLRPIALGPFNYDRENYTNDLWIVEGFTRYYENATVNRTNLFSRGDYLNELERNISYVVNQSGRSYQSLADASFDAWIKLYRHNENSDNSTINYYNQGALIAMLLDLEIIHDTQGKYRLDDAMRYMYHHYALKLGRGYTDHEFRIGLEHFTQKSLREFYEKYINGTAPVDINRYLNFAGYKLTDENSGSNNPWIGADAEKVNGGLKVIELVRNSSFYSAGISVNDIIISVDDVVVTDISDAVKNKKPGDGIRVAVLRDGLPMTFNVKLIRRPYFQYHIDSLKELTQEQMTIRKRWLE